MVRNLPPLPQGRVYQLWVAGTDGTRESAGMLTWTDQAGNGYTLIKCPEKLSRWQSFRVTEEPAGGSHAPTRDTRCSAARSNSRSMAVTSRSGVVTPAYHRSVPTGRIGHRRSSSPVGTARW